MKEVNPNDTMKQFITGTKDASIVKKSHEDKFKKSSTDDLAKRMGFDLRKGGN